LKAISRELAMMFLANTVFVALYLIVNWAEYVSWNGQLLETNFPWNIMYSPKSNGPGLILVIQQNWTLWIFLVGILMNFYFLIRLRRSSIAR